MLCIGAIGEERMGRRWASMSLAYRDLKSGPSHNLFYLSLIKILILDL